MGTHQSRPGERGLLAKLNSNVKNSHNLNLHFDHVVKELAPDKKKWWVYVLGVNSREGDPYFYIGCTGRLQGRMQEHRSGTAGLCGKNKIPKFQQLPSWLIGAIELPTKEVAILYESYLHEMMLGVEKPKKNEDLPNIMYNEPLQVKEQLMKEKAR